MGSAGRAVLSLKTCSGSFLFVIFVPAAGNLPKLHFSAEPFISLGWMRCSIAPSLFSSKYLALTKVCMCLDERGHDAEKAIGPLVACEWRVMRASSEWLRATLKECPSRGSRCWWKEASLNCVVSGSHQSSPPLTLQSLVTSYLVVGAYGERVDTGSTCAAAWLKDEKSLGHLPGIVRQARVISGGPEETPKNWTQRKPKTI